MPLCLEPTSSHGEIQRKKPNHRPYQGQETRQSRSSNSEASRLSELIKYLDDEEVGEVPCRHESVFQMSPHFFFIKLDTTVKCIPYTFQHFVVNVIPYRRIRNMCLQFAAPALKSDAPDVTAPSGCDRHCHTNCEF